MPAIHDEFEWLACEMLVWIEEVKNAGEAATYSEIFKFQNNYNSLISVRLS